jgi:hypothetical protein
MPVNFIKNGYKGYLEDRRPNSEGDPYQIVSRHSEDHQQRSRSLLSTVRLTTDAILLSVGKM